MLFGLSPGLAADHAVVLLYHHVSNDTPASTSVSPSVFEEHLEYLDEHEFTVWPLSRILDALASGRAIPENTVAITFDDAYRSVYTEAFPRLRQRKWPFTVFVGTEAIDRGYKSYLNWDQIRELTGAGAEVGNHSHSHDYLVRSPEGETMAQWQQRVAADIEHAGDRLEKETGFKTTLFAYPYGEYSRPLKEIVRSMGYRGIAQRSGAVGVDSDFLMVPRFPMLTGFADIERFSIAVNSRPLPVRSAIESGPETPDGRIDKLLLTLGEGSYRVNQLGCYDASGTRQTIETFEDQPYRISITLNVTATAGRKKINCTAPAINEPGVFYWYSYQWLVNHADGRQG